MMSGAPRGVLAEYTVQQLHWRLLLKVSAHACQVTGADIPGSEWGGAGSGSGGHCARAGFLQP